MLLQITKYWSFGGGFLLPSLFNLPFSYKIDLTFMDPKTDSLTQELHLCIQIGVLPKEYLPWLWEKNFPMNTAPKNYFWSDRFGNYSFLTLNLIRTFGSHKPQNSRDIRVLRSPELTPKLSMITLRGAKLFKTEHLADFLMASPD